MSDAGKGRIAIYTAVFATVAVGSILAVLAHNPPLGAVAGVVSGVLVAVFLWPRQAN